MRFEKVVCTGGSGRLGKYVAFYISAANGLNTRPTLDMLQLLQTR